jgi:hypothetical protein
MHCLTVQVMVGTYDIVNSVAAMRSIVKWLYSAYVQEKKVRVRIIDVIFLWNFKEKLETHYKWKRELHICRKLGRFVWKIGDHCGIELCCHLKDGCQKVGIFHSCLIMFSQHANIGYNYFVYWL